MSAHLEAECTGFRNRSSLIMPYERMDWRTSVLLLLAVSVTVSAQRGSRRYVPDQPLEETLPADNHRFRSRNRDASGEVQKEGRRGVTQTPIEQNQRLNSASRTRGRTEEPRQYHSIPSRREQQTEERQQGRQFHSRKNQEPERSRASSREEVQSQRFKSRESQEVTEPTVARGGRGRVRSEVKDTQASGRRGASVTRFSSRTPTDTDSQSANHESVRNRAGARGRTATTSRNIPSRSSSLPDATQKTFTRPLPTGTAPDKILSRADFVEPDLIPMLGQEQRIESKLTTASVENIALSTKLNDIGVNVQDFSGVEGEKPKIIEKDQTTGSDIQESILNESISPDDSKISNSVTPPYENIIEYPSKLNDVEESHRASRRLDTAIPESSQSSRSRTRVSEDTLPRRTEDSKYSRGENVGRTATRGRSSDVKSRSRTSEDQYETRSRSRTSGELNESRSRNIGPSRSSRLDTPVKSQRQEDVRNKDHEGRSRSESTRNIRVDSLSRGRSNLEDTPKSKSSGSRGKYALESRTRSSLEEKDKNKKLEYTKNSPEIESHSRNVEGQTRNIEGRSRRPSTESFSPIDSKRRPEKPSLNPRERPQESPKKDNNAVKTTHRYSAKIPDTTQIRNEQKPSSSLFSRGRPKELANFRVRSKVSENLATPGDKLSDVVPSSAPLAEVLSGRKQTTNPLPEEKNEIASSPPTETTLQVTTAKSLESLLHRKPGANRPRGPAKGPKLQEDNHSGEVSDDDNYPEVYKQLKKSGTSPKEILV